MPFQIQNTKVISNEVQHNKQVSCQRFLHKNQQKDGNKLCVIRCSGNKIFQIDHHAMYPFPTLLWTKSSGWWTQTWDFIYYFGDLIPILLHDHIVSKILISDPNPYFANIIFLQIVHIKHTRHVHVISMNWSIGIRWQGFGLVWVDLHLLFAWGARGFWLRYIGSLIIP